MNGNSGSVMSGAPRSTVKSLMGRSSKNFKNKKPMYGNSKGGGKVKKVMHEWKSGSLHSGSKKGPVVKSRKQAIAIALNQARKK